MSTYSYRITTNGVLRNYRSGLYKSYNTLYTAMERVQTSRNYNAYAEDPSSASRAFQLRRSIWRANDAINNTNNAISIYQVAWNAMDSICDGNDDHPGFDAIKENLNLITGTAGSSRISLGQTLESEAKSIVQLMNAQYSGNFVFAGADGHNLPFTWGTDANGKDVLLYRGINVSTPNPKTQEDFVTVDENGGTVQDTEAFEAYRDSFQDTYGMTYEQAQADYAELEKMAGETVYVDIGIGLEEDADGVVPTSAFNIALSGLNILGFGVDEDGDSLNMVTLMKEMGEIAARCDPETGDFQEGDEERANVLTKKMRAALDRVSEKHVELTADTKYLDSNVELLTTNRDAMDEQRAGIEQIDPALAIQELSWAQYSYQAALKIGNSLLSQSLIDYMD